MAHNNIEILAPVGSYESLSAVLKAGADSVYFGVGQLNMRSRSSANFTHDDLAHIVRKCRHCGVKTYLTLNTIIYDTELKDMQLTCDAAMASGVTAVIAADVAVMGYARSIGLPVHISVQANVSNLEAVRFYSAFADVMVLARELTLPQVKTIITGITREDIRGPSGQPVRIELFAHGALCVSVSGKCYMSLGLYNASANRGACIQNCRRSYRVTDTATGMELELDHEYVMSPKDICTINIMDQLISAGVSVFKLEGRGRSPDYAYKVTRAYREAADACLEHQFSTQKVEYWLQELNSVFNRGFWMGGYYLGEPLGEWSGANGNCATKTKYHLGKVNKYFSKLKVVEIELEAGDLSLGDEIFVSGPTTGAVFCKITEIRIEEQPALRAAKGTVISIPTPEKLRPNDKVYLIKDKKFGEDTRQVSPSREE